MDKWTVARSLDLISRYLELSEPNPFKARAFERAARKIEGVERDITQLVDSGEILKVEGIGKATAEIITELVRSGSSRYLEELRAQYPAGIFEMLRVPGLGLRKIGMLHEELGIGSLEQLEEAARAGKLAKLKGFGAKTQQKILEGVEFARMNESRFLLPYGIEVAEKLREQLGAIETIVELEVSGSVRRRLEIIRNVNIAIATRDDAAVIEAIGERALVENFERVDETTVKGRARGEMDVVFHFSKPDDFGALLLRTTGSAAFVEAFEKKIAGNGYELRERGLFHKGRHVTARTEHDLFEKVEVPFVDPERRESGDDLARKKRTRLIELADLRGTFHVHTTWSDGRNSVREMLHAARERGFDYVGLSDHSKAAYYAGGLSDDRVKLQQAEIGREERDVTPMRVFRGTEADILPDGAMDYDDETMATFDFVIASVHSQFKMSTDEMTERILLALDNPYVTFIGHLTGRKLLGREGYSVDYDRIFEKAGERGVMIELNGNPHRLDLDWRHVGRALDRGVQFSIHPDAHSTKEFNAVISGTWVARKAGLPAKAIFNSRPVEEVEAYLAARKKAAQKKKPAARAAGRT